MIVMIDNYDSFTYNLVHYLEALQLNGQPAEVKVIRNDAMSVAEVEQLRPERIIISPGPCSPNEAGISLAVIEHFMHKLPILGVCLGHQALGQVFGAQVVRARQVMHGKTSSVYHQDSRLFQGMNHPLTVTRYHSLVLQPGSIPDCLKVSAWTENANKELDCIMAIEHESLPLMGVQFHPESILTEQGHALLQNFLNLS